MALMANPLLKYMQDTASKDRDIAQVLECGIPHVWKVKNGVNKPSLRLAILMEKKLGIACADWDGFLSDGP